MIDPKIYQQMQSEDFRQRAAKLSARVEAGWVPTNDEVAEALDLPLDFIEEQAAHQAAQFFFPEGGKQ